MNYTDWGIIDYLKAWKHQEEIFNTILDAKKKGLPTHSLETLVICEHPHVFTLGKKGDKQNLLINEERLQNVNAAFYHIDRGGDITYHGPGQIVCYPILDLENHALSLKSYIYEMENAVIKTLADYGIVASRLEHATGVWIEPGSKNARKICAIGVRASRFVTMHGLAFNVNTNLDYFSYINPCGFVDKGVTSMEKELGHELDMNEVKVNLLKQFMKFLE